MSPNPTQKRQLQERLDVSEAVLQDAVSLYRQLDHEELDDHLDGSLPIAVLYVAIRQHGIARNIDEIAAVADVTPRTLYRTARLVSDRLGTGIPPVEPERYLVRLTDRFDLDTAVESEAFRVLASAKSEEYHAGRKPAGVAAAALYTALDIHHQNPRLSQRELCEATGVHERTLREHYKQIRALVSST
jgi:transcription initiation factor TFIIB